jgi:hypothetical protein
MGGQEIPPEALSGDAVVVTSVQNVFHAKSGHPSLPTCVRQPPP